jgi:asparagine synthase (glutamine-hydrolysing)
MLFSQEQRDGLFGSRDARSMERSQDSLRDNLGRAGDLDAINRVSYLEARCYMLNTLLRDSDAMSMAHGLELRVPLIDHHLAKRLLALPGRWKLNGHRSKPLLVAALRGTLPDHIVHRRKRGFTLPFEHWLRDELRSEVEVGLWRIAEGPLAPLFEPRSVSHVWQDFHQGKTSWSRPWSLYVLQRWCELHGVNA